MSGTKIRPRKLDAFLSPKPWLLNSNNDKLHSVQPKHILTTSGWLMLCRAARMIPPLSRQQLPMVCVPSNRRSTRRNASSRDTSGCSTSMSGAGCQSPAWDNHQWSSNVIQGYFEGSAINEAQMCGGVRSYQFRCMGQIQIHGACMEYTKCG